MRTHYKPIPDRCVRIISRFLWLPRTIENYQRCIGGADAGWRWDAIRWLDTQEDIDEFRAAWLDWIERGEAWLALEGKERGHYR